jgi:hypothetical protein
MELKKFEETTKFEFTKEEVNKAFLFFQENLDTLDVPYANKVNEFMLMYETETQYAFKHYNYRFYEYINK